MIKRFLALFLVALMTFSLAACGGDEDGVSSTASDSQVVAEVESAASEDDKQETTSKEETASKEESSKDATTSKDETASEDDKTPTDTTTSKQQGTASKITGTVSTGGTTSKNEVKVEDLGVSIKPNAAVNLKVNTGESGIEDLDFGGKTFTMAITQEGQFHTAAFKRCVAAFEVKYNCKIQLKQLNFGLEYGQQVQQAQAAGNPFDICNLHGSYFPQLALDNIYEPLNNYIYQGDLATSSTSGGIDINKTSYYALDNKIYGVSTFDDVYPRLIYYNKKMLADAGYSGAKDPRKLAEKGNWTWDVIYSMGKRLTDSKNNKYFLSSSFVVHRAINSSFGCQMFVYDTKTKKYKQNITSEDWVLAYTLKQKLGVGPNRICDPKATIDVDPFVRGEHYMWTQEASKYIDFIESASKSSAFGKKKSNVGIVELPLGGNNKDRYPTGFITAVASGKSTKKKSVDPRVAVAWALFRSKNEDPNEKNDITGFSTEDRKYVDSLIAGNICCDIGRFYSSDTDTEDVIYYTGLDFKLRNGGVIAQEIAAYKDKVQACIDYTMGY